VAPDSPVRGYAHVIKEDLVNPNLLFLGTELGLWVSVDGGKQWAHYKGGDLPAVAVRDLGSIRAIMTRDGNARTRDLDRRRHLAAPGVDARGARQPGRVSARSSDGAASQSGGGWANGDAMFVGANPPATP